MNTDVQILAGVLSPPKRAHDDDDHDEDEDTTKTPAVSAHHGHVTYLTYTHTHPSHSPFNHSAPAILTICITQGPLHHPNQRVMTRIRFVWERLNCMFPMYLLHMCKYYTEYSAIAMQMCVSLTNYPWQHSYQFMTIRTFVSVMSGGAAPCTPAVVQGLLS